VDGYCSGSLSDAEFAEFEEALRHAPELRRQLLEYRMLDSDLRSFASAASEMAVVETAGQQHTGKVRRLRLELLAAAVAIILLLGVVGRLVLRDVPSVDLRDIPIAGTTEAEPVDYGVAVVARAVGAEWKDAILLPSDSVAPGHFELLKGVVELEFYSGASVILEAPAALEVLSENAGILHYGKLRAHVPFQAQGFTIRTREIELVDLGTEFAMEVAEDTGTAVHVIDGKVELFVPDQPADKGKELVAGQGRLVDPSGSLSEIAANPDHFMSREELAQQERELQERTYQRWLAASARLREDPRLLAYYDFQPKLDQERVLTNLSLNTYPGLDGAIVGARWKWGRWREHKRALDFKSAGDRVLIEVQEIANSMTLVTWVRMDRSLNPYSLLLHSHFWQRPGAVQWRIQKRGSIELQVNNGQSPKQETSDAPLDMQPGDFQRWMSLAAVYDGQRGIVSQYRNGILLGVSKPEKMVPLEIGKAEIANRIGPDEDSRKIRHFNGRIGELMIFNEALSASEIAELHQNGNKYD
jgi:hypothetical protein